MREILKRCGFTLIGLFLVGSLAWAAGGAQQVQGVSDSGLPFNPPSAPASAAAPSSALSLAAYPPGTSSITTMFASNNEFAGNMFDVTAIKPITIQGFDFNIEGSLSTTAFVYYRVGTYVGHESDPTGWVLLGTASVTGQGFDVPTPVPIGGLTIPAGQTYGLYVGIESGTLYYTNGNNVYSNGDLTLTLGIAKGFGITSATFSPRTWNGTIYYTIAFGRTFYDDGNTSSVCLSSTSGSFQWDVNGGPSFTGTLQVYNGGTMFWSQSGALQYVYIYYDPNSHMAWGYLYDYSTGLYSSLYDTNTLNNPSGCGVFQVP